jgi:parvulin-like peptidyl-prolyl isomerase
MAQKKSGLTRRQQGRRRKDEQLQRYLTWGAIALGVIVVAILAYGIVTEMVIKPGQTVAQVGEDEITVGEYESRVSYERYSLLSQYNRYRAYVQQLEETELDESQQATLQQAQAVAAQLQTQLSPELATLFGGQQLDRMIEESLIRQEATERGLEVTEEEVDRAVELYFGYDRDAEVAAGGTVTETASTMTEAQFNEFYESYQTVFELSEFSSEDFRQMLATNLLRNQLQEAMMEELEAEEEQVQLSYLAAPTEEEAQALKARLDEGEEMSALIEELAADESPETVGRTTDWTPKLELRTQLGPEAADRAFNLPPETTTEPIQGPNDRYYVLYVEGRETRPLSPGVLQRRAQMEYDRWLSAAQDKVERTPLWEEVTPTEPQIVQ